MRCVQLEKVGPRIFSHMNQSWRRLGILDVSSTSKINRMNVRENEPKKKCIHSTPPENYHQTIIKGIIYQSPI
jgi:demethoxyubiquinone hydroxylase (CLK1/Coq7/Cat5 family)